MKANSCLESLHGAVQQYFDLMYDCDVTKFDQVFSANSQLHGIRSGELSVWTADNYKEILQNRQSPKSLGALREEQILLVDFASTTQALVKVRVRINNTIFVDYLTWHRVGSHWLITSKAYHIESSDGA